MNSTRKIEKVEWHLNWTSRDGSHTQEVINVTWTDAVCSFVAADPELRSHSTSGIPKWTEDSGNNPMPNRTECNQIFDESRKAVKKFLAEPDNDLLRKACQWAHDHR